MNETIKVRYTCREEEFSGEVETCYHNDGDRHECQYCDIELTVETIAAIGSDSLGKKRQLYLLCTECLQDEIGGKPEDATPHEIVIATEPEGVKIIHNNPEIGQRKPRKKRKNSTGIVRRRRR